MKEKNVVLFKAPSEYSDQKDKYCQYLESRGHKVHIVPVIQFRYVNTEKLEEALENTTEYDSIIFTSTRAVQAVANITGSAKCLEKKKIFVVGETSRSVVQDKLGLSSEGGETGSADSLADFIIHHHSSSKMSFLFPASNLAKDVISSRLEDAGHRVNRIDCYITEENKHLKDYLENVQNMKNNVMVFFSPSGVDTALKYINQEQINKYKFISLGETTRQALIKYNIEKVTCAKKPNPESLFEAIDNLII